MSVGRNESCPCGSGKKFKKCCGKVEGLAIHGVLLEELEGLQRELIDYAMENYSYAMKKEFQSQLHKYEMLRKDSQVFLVAFEIWYILTQPVANGRTILEKFVAKRLKTIQRPRTKQIFASWLQAKFVAGQIEESKGTSYIIRDVLSGKRVAVRSRQHVELDNVFIIGGLLPFEQEYTFFMIDFHFEKAMAPKAEAYLTAQLKAAESTNPQDFLAAQLLSVLNQLFTFYNELGQEEEGVDFSELVWEKDSQEKTAEALTAFLQEEKVEELRTQTAVLLWNLYCQKENPTIRKPEIYVAGLFTLLQSYEVVDTDYSNAALAKKLGVSASSLSKRAKEMEEVLKEKLEQGKNAAANDKQVINN